jgi:meiotically up-regulated gene 157 (Mug157) protein
LAFIEIDPYANAFNISENDNCWQKDFVDQSPWVFERKFELDSLSTVLDLSLRIFACGINEHLDEQFAKTLEIILSVIEKEQKHDAESYVFIRKNVPSYDFLSHAGKGAPFSHTGMVWSAFRPSDDACTFNYHIPDNLHLARCLIDISRLSYSNDWNNCIIANEVVQEKLPQDYNIKPKLVMKSMSYQTQTMNQNHQKRNSHKRERIQNQSQSLNMIYLQILYQLVFSSIILFLYINTFSLCLNKYSLTLS